VNEDPQIINHLEELGPAQVRLLLTTGGLPPLWQPTIIRWLAENDRQERESDRASRVELSQMAHSANKAAWIAAIVAAISMIIAWLAWVWPHP